MEKFVVKKQAGHSNKFSGKEKKKKIQAGSRDRATQCNSALVWLSHSGKLVSIPPGLKLGFLSDPQVKT